MNMSRLNIIHSDAVTDIGGRMNKNCLRGESIGGILVNNFPVGNERWAQLGTFI